MRHRKAGRKFKRSPEHRQMLLRNLATSLFQHGRITTTLAKAKETQPYAEKLITLARGGLSKGDTRQAANFRLALSKVTIKDVCFKLFLNIGPEFKERPGGYTRIYKLPYVRQGDCAPMAVLCLIGHEAPPEPEAKDDKKKSAPTPAAKIKPKARATA
jgi:large subunit ribosomal protein L17